MYVCTKLKRFADGSFAALEAEAGVVPYEIGEEEFPRMLVLVDGIYPPHSRFVSGISVPITEVEKKFTAWQEAARKDIERAFGVIQACWKFTALPMKLFNMATISARVATCMMLHNMLVADRVMDGDVYARYVPSNRLEDCYIDLELASLTAQAGDVSNNEDLDDEDSEAEEDSNTEEESIDEQNLQAHTAELAPNDQTTY